MTNNWTPERLRSETERLKKFFEDNDGPYPPCAPRTRMTKNVVIYFKGKSV